MIMFHLRASTDLYGLYALNVEDVMLLVFNILIVDSMSIRDHIIL